VASQALAMLVAEAADWLSVLLNLVLNLHLELNLEDYLNLTLNGVGIAAQTLAKLMAEAGARLSA
jgi:hypothetical protein